MWCGSEVLAVFTQEDGEPAKLEFVKTDVAGDIGRWMTQGLIEMVLDGTGPHHRRQRVTKPEDPMFLDRVAAYVHNYHFTTELA